MDLEQIRQEYKNRLDRYESLKKEVIYILQKEINKRKIPIHDISGRVKELDSLIDKAVERKIENPFDEINDICGVRIICLFLSDITAIREIIENCFEINFKDDKLLQKSEEQFGYMSIHFIGQIPADFHGHRYDDLKGLEFEIQLRTIAMHSWSTISHYLDYKSKHSIPSHLRKDFYALSALFYLVDSHFELFFNAREESKKSVDTKIKENKGLQEDEINFDTFRAFLKEKYPNRKHTDDPQIISLVLEEIVDTGYETIAELERDLNRSEKAFKLYEKKYPPSDMETQERVPFSDIGVVRTSLCLVNAEYRKHLTIPEDPEELDKYDEFIDYIDT
jgi:ppGpp synthetase/RelA/SpoT-type nucleotidyltranferase